jgi:hypothetical protein
MEVSRTIWFNPINLTISVTTQLCLALPSEALAKEKLSKSLTLLAKTKSFIPLRFIQDDTGIMGKRGVQHSNPEPSHLPRRSAPTHTHSLTPSQILPLAIGLETEACRNQITKQVFIYG